MDAEDQERIFMEIYGECDNDNTNNVQISVLLSYIGPYIDSNSQHFEELKKSLDPTNVNPFIDRQTFLNAMMNWTEKFKNEVDFNFNTEDISRQSTPTRNLRVDYEGLNLSSISAYSLTGSALSTIDPNVLQDQNNELLHQNKKLTECLDDVKYQLTGMEEQNVSLQNEIDRINKNSLTDQKLIKTLQAKCAEYEKDREEHNKIVNENKVNYENLLLIKRTKNELESRIKELETQNKAHIERIEKLSDSSKKKEAENVILRKEIKERDAEIFRIQEMEAEWRQKCAQNELNVKNLIAETDDLKSQIHSLSSALLKNNGGPQNENQKPQNFEPDVHQEKSISLSPEDDDLCECVNLLAMQQRERESPHESLQSELSHISSSECFHSCEHRINQLEDEVGKLYEELSEKNEEVEMVRKAKGLVEEELATVSKEMEAFNDKYNLLTTELKQSKEHLEVALKEKQPLSIEIKQINSKLAYYKTINKNFKQQLDRKTTEVITMRNKLRDKDAQLTNFEKEIEAVGVAQEKLEKLKKELSSREDENKDLIGRMMDMKSTLSTFQEEVKDLKETNCKLMNEMSSLERAAKLERKRNTRVDLNSKINELEEQVEQLKAKNQQLTSSISALISDKKQLIAKLEVLENNDHGKRKVESLEAKLHKYRKRLSDLENQVTCKTSAAHEAIAKYQDLSVDLKKCEEKYVKLIAYIADVKVVMKTNKDLLKTTTYYTSDVWKDIFTSTIPDLSVSNLLNIGVVCEEGVKHVDEGPLQDEINLLNNQIHVTAILLKAFAKIKNKVALTNEERKEAKWKTAESSVRNLCNPHESSSSSNNESFLSKLSPKRFFQRPPTLLLKSKSKTHFVFSPIPMSPEECPQPEPEMQMSSSLKSELNNNVSSLSEEQSTLTKTYSDSLIEKILMEQKIEEPLAKIEDNETLGNSSSESLSSSNDEDAITTEKKDTRKKLRRERKIRDEEDIIKERLTRQVRSMSEGAAVVHQVSKDGDVMVFPNLQDKALDTLGLLTTDDQSKERLTEEQVELKFQTLALAFSIDAVTIRDRLERQQRQRDQAEDNLGAEVARFVTAVHRLHPLCVDAETTELVTTLLDRLQIIVQASHRISTSAEIFGSVQQEWRIAESVNLMLSHLRNLIKQRDAARRQLQITKRMLQETTSPSVLKPAAVAGTTRRLTINTLPVTPHRRASIDVIQRPLDSPTAALVRRGVAVRRTSEAVSGERPELSARHWDYRKLQEHHQLSRPSRLGLDINLELSKIQEGSTESYTSNTVSSSDEESVGFATPTLLLLDNNPFIAEPQKLVNRLAGRWGRCWRRYWERCVADGTLHEVCCVGATLCFATATLLLWNTVVEVELARDGVHRHVPWRYLTWEEFFSLFYSK